MPIATKAEEHECCGRVPTKHKSPVDPAESEVTQWLNPRNWNDPRRLSGVISCLRKDPGWNGLRDVPSGAARARSDKQKTGRKNPTQHRYHITASGSSQRENEDRATKSVPCTKTGVCIWGTFRLEKLENSCYLIVTKRRYLNSRTSGGLPKAKVNQGNQSDFKSK